MAIHHLEWKCIVACSHRRVRREYSRRLNVLSRFFEFQSGQNEFANPFQNHEGRVTFVRMENVRELPQSPKNADASYPQDDLLADPVVFVSAIETGCEFP